MKSSVVLRNMKCPHRLSSLKPWSPAGVHVGKVVELLVGEAPLWKVGHCKEALKFYNLSDFLFTQASSVQTQCDFLASGS